ncbi:hypothetical protein HXS80_20670 [Streptomyces sp. CB04723]|uniref:hypothetical protein n=1 Tax=Streptomyces TaxID=1883 RepID=UPI0015C4B79F|nr:hypothetical protein [Streptomyces sp. CB04723]QLG33817.1 hypothetical protein HXS80_20670 [Streptomyces sp. CB04723]
MTETQTAETPLTPVEQHHYDTITERIGLNRLAAEEAAVRGEKAPGPAEETAPVVTVPDPAAIREAVTEQAVLGALLDEVKAAYAAARTEAEHLLTQQYKATGSTKVDVNLPDGTKVGSITRTPGETAAKVIDEERFRAWVRDTYPSEHVVKAIPMRIVAEVQPGFTAKLLAEMTAAGRAQYADPTTGEVHDVPGVAIAPARAASTRITYGRKSKGQPLTGRELIAGAWQGQGLAARYLPALAPAAVPPAAE